jgi:YspA, cpYpsA-related SLOG family
VKVLVCGSRSWDRPPEIGRRLAALPPHSEIIHGGARGADQIAATYARALGLPEKEFPPNWGRGRNAGIIRNLQMLDEQPDLVLAFWDGVSTGTKHTIEEAQRRGIPVEVVE